MAKYTVKSFFDEFKYYAMQDMKQTGILASLTAAQAKIESRYGNSKLTVECNNLFGIKGKYNGQSGRYLTTEYRNGIARKEYADFRKYPSWAESVADHSGLFNRLERYKNLRGETDYVKACNNVKADGYATSPTYATTLLQCINQYKLYVWDAEVLGKMPQKQKVLSITDYYPVLKLGSRGDHVLAWQRFLNLSGFPCGLEDGIYGKNTRLAVMEYQQSRGLKADGIVGPATWNSLPKAA